MRIVSWNCKYFWAPRYYGFSDAKHQKITTEYPNDILLIQEITYKEYVKILYKNQYISSDWYCDGKNSITGIAIFSNKYKIEKLIDNLFYLPFRYIVPYKINELEDINNEYFIYAVWAKEKIEYDKLHKFDYTENIVEALEYFEKIKLLNSKSIIIGDFNCATTKEHSYDSYKKLINIFTELEFINCAKLNEPNIEYGITYIDTGGKEFTDDYCFISKSIIESNDIFFEIGKKDNWIKDDLSDHCPICVTINKKNG